MTNEDIIPKKELLKIFIKDDFTCQCCGSKTPEVLLDVEHINPCKSIKTKEYSKFFTICVKCKRGSGKKTLLPEDELIELKEKQTQLQMMIDWKKQLDFFIEEQVEKIDDLIFDCSETKAWLNNEGRQDVKRLIKRFGFDEVYESTKIAFESYLESDTEEAFNYVYKKIKTICQTRKNDKKYPTLKSINLLVKTAECLLGDVDKPKIKHYLLNNYEEDDFDYIKDIIHNSSSEKHLIYKLMKYYGDI